MSWEVISRFSPTLPPFATPVPTFSYVKSSHVNFSLPTNHNLISPRYVFSPLKYLISDSTRQSLPPSAIHANHFRNLSGDLYRLREERDDCSPFLRCRWENIVQYSQQEPKQENSLKKNKPLQHGDRLRNYTGCPSTNVREISGRFSAPSPTKEGLIAIFLQVSFPIYLAFYSWF